MLFIKWSVTADEWLMLKVNGICHRASKDRYHTEIHRDSEKEGQTWAENMIKKKKKEDENGHVSFLFLLTRSPSEKRC